MATEPTPPRRPRRLLVIGVAVALIAAVAVVAVVAGGGGDGGDSTTSDTTSPHATHEAVVAEIPLPGARAIVAADGSAWVEAEEGIARIDSATNEVVLRTLRDETIGGLALGSGSVWVATYGDELIRLDATTGEETARVDAPGTKVAVGADAVWVSDYDSNTVTRVDPTTNQVVDTINVKGEPDDIAAGEGAAWVAGFTKAGFHRIDAATNEVTSVVEGVDGSAVTVGEGAVWLLSSGALRHIDPTTLEVTPIESSDLCGSAVSVGGGSVWTGCLGDVAHVDPSGSDVSVTTDAVPDHDGLVYGDDALWLTDWSDGRVYRLDPARLS